jgi:hypothetical protein
MGMDISGLCPRRRADLTAEEQARDWGTSLAIQARCGEYFRANVWSWGAILSLSVEADLYEDELDIDFRTWRYNDGAGLKTQRECDLLAGAIEALLRSSFDEGDDQFADDPFFGDFVLWVDATGECQVARPAGAEVASNYRASGHHTWMWVAFLRNCGGFAIY